MSVRQASVSGALFFPGPAHPLCVAKTVSSRAYAGQVPMCQTSTPRISNFSPSSLSGSFPNVGHADDTPRSRLSSSHSP